MIQYIFHFKKRITSFITTADSQQEAEEVEALNLQEALKAGNFLAGCRVYLTGFTPIHTEKLRRVLGAGGASRLSHLTESVTHVLLGMCWVWWVGDMWWVVVLCVGCECVVA